METPSLKQLAWAAGRLAEGDVRPEALAGHLSPPLLASSSSVGIAESFNRCHAAIASFRVEERTTPSPGRAVALLRDDRGARWELEVQVEAQTGAISALTINPSLTAAPRRALLEDPECFLGEVEVPAISIAAAQGSGPVHASCWGVRHADEADPITIDDRFQMGSLSKVVCQLLAHQLHDQGLIDLDKDVGGYLSSWQLPAFCGRSPQVTLRQLLRHRGGVNVPSLPGYPQQLYGSVTLTDMLLGSSPARNPPVRIEGIPGSAYCYSGGGYCIVEQALADGLGASYRAIAEELLCQPLGITESCFGRPANDRAKRVEAHLRDRPDGNAALFYVGDAAASMCCTPSQMVELVHSTLFAPDAPDRTSAITPEFEKSGVLVHTGATAGFSARLEIIPHKQFVSCVVTNSGNAAGVVAACAKDLREQAW